MSAALWTYVPSDDLREPWFERDCLIYAAAEKNDSVPLAEVDTPSWLHRVYRVLDMADDGLLNATEIARTLLRCRDRSMSLKAVSAQVVDVVMREVDQFGPESVFRQHVDFFCLSRREYSAIASTLISEPYRRLGMTLIKPMLFKFIANDSEHRFFEIKTSTVPNAGLGVFVRPGRHIRRGTLIAEYRGVASHKPIRGAESYTVKLAAGSHISAIDSEGNITCLAGVVNDDGDKANCEIHEFEEVPGRVFFVALRDLEPCEEVFVKYGAAYWGVTSYGDLKDSNTGRAPPTDGITRQRKRKPSIEATTGYCRCCKRLIERRVLRLHRLQCEDEMANTPLCLDQLDSLPSNPFTCCADNADQFAMDRAVYFVTVPKFTTSFTHETIAKKSDGLPIRRSQPRAEANAMPPASSSDADSMHARRRIRTFFSRPT